jgi:hypothetical protein
MRWHLTLVLIAIDFADFRNMFFLSSKALLAEQSLCGPILPIALNTLAARQRQRISESLPTIGSLLPYWTGSCRNSCHAVAVELDS